MLKRHAYHAIALAVLLGVAGVVLPPYIRAMEAEIIRGDLFWSICAASGIAPARGSPSPLW